MANWCAEPAYCGYVDTWESYLVINETIDLNALRLAPKRLLPFVA